MPDIFTKLPTRRIFSGFTLIEAMVTIALAGLLLSVSMGVVVQSRARARAVKCMSNQQQISHALLSFYTEHSYFPSDNPNANLAAQLDFYIPWPNKQQDVALPDVYHCPNDPSGKLANSYEPYYVQRKGLSGSEYFVLGCPRHTDVNESFINVCGINTLSCVKQGAVTINGAATTLEDPLPRRSMNSGVMAFEDGSTATVTRTSPDYSVSVTACFRQPDGRLYTIVRVHGEGTTKFSVTPGSKFEVISPLTVIGVRGTQFTVVTGTGYAKVYLNSGQLHVLDRQTQIERLIDKPGETVEIVDTTIASVGLPKKQR